MNRGKQKLADERNRALNWRQHARKMAEGQGYRVGFMYFPYPDSGHTSETWNSLEKDWGPTGKV
jgi:hypothetical protein